MDYDNFDAILNITALPSCEEVIRFTKEETVKYSAKTEEDMDKPISLDRRIALQSILGSDPIRDMLSLIRADQKEKYPVMLFKPSSIATSS